MQAAGPKKVDQVLLVGGMTRTPAVVEKVKEVFGLNPMEVPNPDEVGMCVSLHCSISNLRSCLFTYSLLL